MEDLDSFFQLLEFHFPQLFAGATQTYREIKPRNVDPIETSRQVKKSTREQFNKIRYYEYKLYKFVLQRLHKAKTEILI